MKRRALAFFMTLVLALSLVPGTAFAVEEKSGNCGAISTSSNGENLTWTLDENGELTISGEGEMGDYLEVDAPWFDSRKDIETVIIESGVTSIGGYAFYYCDSLTSVTIPDGVTSIGYGAFEYCSSLTSVNIPDGVTSIGDYAFNNCSSLTSVNIPDGVISIGDYAFNNCSSLTSVTIPDSVTSIGRWAFNCCSSLTDVYFDGSEEQWRNITIQSGNDCLGDASIHYSEETPGQVPTDEPQEVASGTCGASSSGDNLTWTLDENGELTISGEGEMDSYPYSTFTPWNNNDEDIKTVTIESGVTNIGEWAFAYCSSLNSVSIAESVTSIGGDAFCGCSNLSSVIIPDNVTSVGAYAFCNCSNLPSVVIPSMASIDYCAFQGCSSLTSVTIPDSVTNIVRYAFTDCSSLTSVTIPASMTSISDGLFSGCSSLTSVTIPASVTTIGKGAFSDCSSLTDVNYGGSALQWKKNIEIQPGNDPLIMATIHCSGETVDETEIVDSGICSAKGDNLKWELDFSGTLTISGKGEMEDYGGGVAASGSSLVARPWEKYLWQISSVVLESGVTSIGDYAFSYCYNLEEVTISEGVTRIGSYAFFGCESLPSVDIPESVTSIGECAFYGCGLTSISIPAGVAKLGNGVVSACGALSQIKVDEGNKAFRSDAFGALFSKDGTELIQYPSGNECKNYTIPKGVTSIGDSAFSDCYRLESVTIPNGVTSIGVGAFYRCDSLREVSIPSSVKNIGNYAFQGCYDLTNVHYGGSKSQWDAIEIQWGNDCLTGASIRFSYTPPTPPSGGGGGGAPLSGGGGGGGEGLIQLDAPTDLTWGRHYSEENSSYTEVPGYISWKHPQNTQFEYSLRVYTTDDKLVYSTWWTDYPYEYEDYNRNDLYHSSSDFILECPESGDYYFTVQSIGDGTQYSDSEIVTSDTWHYEKPAVSCGKVTNLSLTQDAISWTWPTDCSNAGGFAVEFFFRGEKSESPIPVHMYWCDHPGVEYLFEENPYSDSIEDFMNDVYLEYGSGDYSARVMLISKDITKYCNGPYTEVSNTITPEGSIDYAKEKLNRILDTAQEISTVEEKNDVLNELKSLDTDTLKTAITADLSGNTNGILEALEETLGVKTAITIDDDMSDIGISAENISLAGAALNANSVEEQMTFAVSKADEETVYPTMYHNTVQFSMSLTSESSEGDKQEIHELDVPIKITMPIPDSINPNFFVVLHKMSDGSYEVIRWPHLVVTYDKEKEIYMASFVVTSFSDFAFAESSLCVGQDGKLTVSVPEEINCDGTCILGIYDQNRKMIATEQQSFSGGGETIPFTCGLEKGQTAKVFTVDENSVPLWDVFQLDG